MTSSPTSKHLIPEFVYLFFTATPSLHIKEACTADTGEEISEKMWVLGLERNKTCSINARLQLIQFKVTHWLHFSKTKLKRIFPSVSPTCDWCKSGNGTQGHLFWYCPKLRRFWVDIFHVYSDIYSSQLDPDCLLPTLGCSDFSLTLPQHYSKLLRSVWL